MIDDKPPSVFISYSLDDETQWKWVQDFATRLRSDGLDAKLDKWELKPGNSVTRFLETAIRDNDFVLLVCTPKYKEGFDLRLSGIEYEAELMTGEALYKNNREKFIPVLRAGTHGESIPAWMMSSYCVDLSNNPYDEKNYNLLIAHLHAERKLPPPIGSKPDFSKTVFPHEEAKGLSVNWKLSGYLVTIKDVVR